MSGSSTEKIAIIGGGPVGCFAALTLASQGRQVEIYERRSDPRGVGAGNHRSINMVLSHRGMQAFESVGLEDVIRGITKPVWQRMIHHLDGQISTQPYGPTKDYALLSVNRNELSKVLLTEAENHPNITIRFDARCVGYSHENRELSFADSQDRPMANVHADVVIGSDGSGSAIREQLSRITTGEIAKSELSHAFKEVMIPALPNGEPPLTLDSFHIWPRGDVMFVAQPNCNGSLTGTLFARPGGAELSFENLQSESQVRDFFQKLFPDVLEMVPNLAAEFVRTPVSRLNMIECAPWNFGGQVCLLGDAAHSMVPFYGQGLNSSLQDVLTYGNLLERTQGDFAHTHAMFYEERKPGADAICELSRRNFHEMSVSLQDPAFIRMKSLMRALEHEFPDRFQSVYQLVTFGTGPYTEALKLADIHEKVLYPICQANTDIRGLDLERIVIDVETAVALATPIRVRDAELEHYMPHDVSVGHGIQINL